MKPLRLLAFAFVFTSALMAEQKVSVLGVPFDVIVPDGWVRLPDKALEGLRTHFQGIQINRAAGFVAPRPPPNSSPTVLMVDYLEVELTPKAYLDFTRASFATDQAEDPGVKMVQDDCRIGMGDRALITTFHANDGRTWRTYAFPSAEAEAIFEFSIFCPTANAAATFAAIESCLAQIRFPAGFPVDLKWIAEMKKTLPPAPKRVY